MSSSLSQIISEKESELARFRQAAADAARQKEDEVKRHMLEVLESLELEIERTRLESGLVIKAAIQQAESDASASIERAKMEMNEKLRQQEDEIFVAARSKIEEEWTAREVCLRGEFQAVLSSELESQHGRLTSQYGAIVQEKDIAMKGIEESMTRRIHDIEEGHLRMMGEMRQKMEEVAGEIWNEACTKFGVAADAKIAHSLAIADAECTARDEQMSMLLEERVVLQKLLSEKEVLLEKSNRDLKEMENASSDRCKRNDEEMSEIIEEARNLARDHDQMKKARHQMESEIDLLRNELSQSKAEYKALQSKHRKQREKTNSFDCEKQRYESRVGELSACKQLLDRQLEDVKEENKELTSVSEGLNKRIEELVRNNQQITDHVRELRQENHDLERKHNAVIAQINSLEQERREYARLIEDGMKQSSRLLAEAIEKNGPKSRTEPVVVHLHGSNGDNDNMIDRLSNECNTLRSKNFLLESELVNIKKGGHVHHQHKNKDLSGGASLEGLIQENNSLKTILSMMRKEMETAGETKDPEGLGNALMLSDLALEQQLFQCRSYLDLLLKTKDPIDGHGFVDDEVAFLRPKYRELHRVTDELREENRRLHRMCNVSSGSNDYDDPTSREKEVIRKLEEATDEIEALLAENEKLAKISNELKFELNKTNGQLSLRNDAMRPPSMRGDSENREHEQKILVAIMNDQSRSSASSPNSVKECIPESEVTCIGRKPPMANAYSRPSKTAYTFRPTMTSDHQRKKKEINRKKKEIAIEKAKIRNWNVKDRTTNPYL